MFKVTVRTWKKCRPKYDNLALLFLTHTKCPFINSFQSLIKKTNTPFQQSMFVTPQIMYEIGKVVILIWQIEVGMCLWHCRPIENFHCFKNAELVKKKP